MRVVIAFFLFLIWISLGEVRKSYEIISHAEKNYDVCVRKQEDITLCSEKYDREIREQYGNYSLWDYRFDNVGEQE